MNSKFRHLEINGGQVISNGILKLMLSPARSGYADAQLDDYGGLKRRDFPWMPGSLLSLRARFSHHGTTLVGTAGFGFWNAPFSDPTISWPSLPQAVWFFYASEQSDLPLSHQGAGQGWFVSTIDATGKKALILAPIAPIITMLNNLRRFERVFWPRIRKRLSISFARLNVGMTEWHSYSLEWRLGGCVFSVDDQVVLSTSHSPSGPLGFVAWLDNQYMVATPRGRLKWGTLPIGESQWLEIEDLQLSTY
jgi:hypothetical protein